MTPRLIALTGYAGSGKSTVAGHLECLHPFERVRFAGPLKDMIKVGFGLSEEHVSGALKEQPCDALGGRSPRYAMQTLGTEWGRLLIHPDIWLMAWKARVLGLLASGERVIADDCRFLNEAAMVRELGGVVWRVVRPGTSGGAHASECEQDKIRADATILNCGSVADLTGKVSALTDRLTETIWPNR